jgi:pimeloyl-ACP methyl ester carboxylesterase
MPSELPVVVLVHGASANAACWVKLVPLLQAKGVQAVAAHVAARTGQSFNDWWRDAPPAPGAPEIRPYGSGSYVALTLKGSREDFAQDLPTDEIALMHAIQGPFAQSSNSETISAAAWRSRPSWFVIGEQDRMLLPDLEQATAKRIGAKTLVLPSGHLPILSHPDEVTDFVYQALSELSHAA